MNAAGKPPRAKTPELVLRAVSGIILLAVALLVTWLGGLPFAAMCAVGAVLMLAEYLQITKAALPAGMRSVVLGIFALVLAAWFLSAPWLAMTIAALGLLVLAGWEVPVSGKLWGAGAITYSLLPFAALTLLRGDGAMGLHIILLLFACVWGTDTAAYFAGRAIGGPRLAPAISPKKTWAGAIGGMSGAVVVSAALLQLTGYGVSLAALALVVALSIVSQIGDLFESWIKRHFGVKDSGAIIPGHGGILDRIDGLIFACVAAWLSGAILGGSLLVPESAGRALFTAFVLP